MTTSSPIGSHPATERGDRLRAAAPVLVSAAVLLGIIVGAAVALRDLLELGLLLLAGN